MYWILAAGTIVGGIAGVCYFWDKIVAWWKRKQAPLPEMPVSRRMAEELGLEGNLKAQGYRLFWGNSRDREYYLLFSDYELIERTDDQGRTWVLGPASGEDLPLKTKFESQEIEKRREERKRKAQDGSSGNMRKGE
jgi:hypothetical protein